MSSRCGTGLYRFLIFAPLLTLGMIMFLPKFMINVTILIFKIVNFPRVHISQRIRFAGASSHVVHLNTCNNMLTR